MELWGGHECTVNRVGGNFADQTVLTGHAFREDDLDAFAELGVQSLRYPVLWERVAPRAPHEQDWMWSDKRLNRIRALDMRPIIGLIHHGSGPIYTDLLDKNFAAGLAAHARQTVQRYSWARDWTPVNEPLTTARFSTLYGHWYPHLRKESAFWRALLNQIDAIRLCMKEIRKVRSDARLVQTEDLGKTHATRPLAYQAEFDNNRRWATWDLLFGRITKEHPLWERLVAFGLADRLRAIADDPCPPDIIGINHYLTSDRFLDHRLERYPQIPAGGNSFMQYVDIEAVRVMQPGPQGLSGVLWEAWSRYRAPIALTEVHNGCTREEQVRWFANAWRTAQDLRRNGVDMVAVTAWSLLGAYNWNTLLTRAEGHYEPGPFDVSSGARRATALARALPLIAADRPLPPEFEAPGWWERDIRLSFAPVRCQEDVPAPTHRRPSSRASRPILIVGATGALGKALARACAWRGLEYVLTDRRTLNLFSQDTMRAAFKAHTPRAVVNAAGWVRVDAAEAERDACLEANAAGAARLARACAEANLPCVLFSSDLVFDGRSQRPYLEHDEPNPLCIYGRSKRDMERAALPLGASILVARTAAFFSPFDGYNFAADMVRELAGGREIHCAADAIVSPTYTPALADAVLDLVLDGADGLWHLANEGAASWYEFALRIAKSTGLDASLIQPRSRFEMGWAARRPAYSALGSARGRLLPSLDEAIALFAHHLRKADFLTEFTPQAHDFPRRLRTL